MAGSRVGRLPVQATQCAPLLNTIEIKIIIAFALSPCLDSARCALILLCPVVPLFQSGSPIGAEDSPRIKNRERSFGSKGGSISISMLENRKPFFLTFLLFFSLFFRKEEAESKAKFSKYIKNIPPCSVVNSLVKLGPRVGRGTRNDCSARVSTCRAAKRSSKRR